MKNILKVLVLLMVTLTISSCFEDTRALRIMGVVEGTPDNDNKECIYEFDAEKGTFLSDISTMMDLAYTKLVGSYTHNYAYILPLGVVNVLDSEIDTRGDVSSSINSVQINSISVKVYTDQNVLVDNDVVTKSIILDPQSSTIIYLPLFRNVLKWEGNTEDTSRNFLYSSLYDNIGGNLLTKYVIVDIVINAETLSGEYASSNHFKYRINLCVDCLLCAGSPTCARPNSLVQACSLRNEQQPFNKLTSSCWNFQDTPLVCSVEESN